MSMMSEAFPETAAPLNAPAARQADVMSVSIDVLRVLLQEAGYRAAVITDEGVSSLRSASNGMAFDVRLGNRSFGSADQYADFVFVALFEVRGSFPLELLNKWNRLHRFGRLFLDEVGPTAKYLVLSYDVSVAGGVLQQSLWSQLAIWDRLVQQLIPWLRDELGKVASSVDSAVSQEAQAPVLASDNA